MPQLLHEMGAEEWDVDFGVLVVYTCAANCDGGKAYKREYVRRQMFQ